MEEVGKAEAIGRSAVVRNFSVGKRRAAFVRGGNAMDGRKRAGRTQLGRDVSKAGQRGFAKMRFSFMVALVIKRLSATRVHSPVRKITSGWAENGRVPSRNQRRNCKTFVTS